MADAPVTPTGGPAPPARPAFKAPELPRLVRRTLAGQWPETEASVNKVVEWLPGEAEFQARKGLAWATAKVEALTAAAPGQILVAAAWLDRTLDKGWTAAKAWVREYLDLKPEPVKK